MVKQGRLPEGITHLYHSNICKQKTKSQEMTLKSCPTSMFGCNNLVFKRGNEKMKGFSPRYLTVNFEFAVYWKWFYKIQQTCIFLNKKEIM
jgi:hypothetical protein